MTFICVLLIIAIPAVVYVLQQNFREAQAQWAVERRELINRLQHPEIVPVQAAPYADPDPEPDDSHLVGQIHLEPEA